MEVESSTKPKPKERDEIFSGKKSTDFWDSIHAVAKKRRRRKIAESARDALYLMGCRCQELETIVRKLSDELTALKAQVHSQNEQVKLN